jgi:hypothetical protein
LEDAALNSYKELLLYTQHETIGDFDAGRLLQDTRFDQWMSRNESAVFILHGGAALIEHPQFFWLSLPAFHIKETLEKGGRPEEWKMPPHQENGHANGSSVFHPQGYRNTSQSRPIPDSRDTSPIVLHCFFQPHYRDQDGCQTHYLITHLISQLFVAKPELAENPERQVRLKQLILQEQWRYMSPDKPCGFLAELLRDIPTPPSIYIILDRIDFCDCHVRALVRSLIFMLDGINRVVKISAVLGPLQKLSESHSYDLKHGIEVYVDSVEEGPKKLLMIE